MSLALGGQTLLTAEARAGAGRRRRCALQSHGHWRIKGVAEPIELFEVGDDDAPFTPPPDAAKAYRVVRAGRPVAAGARRCGTACRPSATPSSAGTRRWLELARALRRRRAAGVGARHRRHRQDAAGDALRLDLARRLPGRRRGSATCRRRAASTASCTRWRRALDVPLGKDDPVVQLGHAIAGRGRCLVILDNFEQVARHAEETLGPLARPRRRGALPGHHARGAGPARRGGAGAARRCRRPTPPRCSCAAPTAAKPRLPAERARTRRRSRRWSSCSTACRWRSSWPRRGCA